MPSGCHTSLLVTSVLAVAAAAIDCASAVAPPVTTLTVQDETRAVVKAANAYLQSLQAGQRARGLFAFPQDRSATPAHFTSSAPGKGPPGGFLGERFGSAVWSNYPVSDVPRPGLQLGQLTASQQRAALQLLRTVLSAEGYRKVEDIMSSDQTLSQTETHFASGRAVYTLALLGQPSDTTPWMIEFGGHHLALNIVISGGTGTITPTLPGAQPALYTANGRQVRVLAAENDDAFALLNALDDGQRNQAILKYRIDDLVAGPGHEAKIVPEGIRGSALNATQRTLLLTVIGDWAGIVNDAYASTRLKQIRADLDDTYFAWSGPTSHAPGKNGSAYYRIQGPTVLIEFSPQGVGGDPTLHVHTIYRDPTNEYGIRFTRP